MATATLDNPAGVQTTPVIEQPIYPDPAGEIPLANILPSVRTFPDAQWLNIPNVPILAEHETMTRKGRRLVFGRKELQIVANNCNRRIRETGDYAGIIVGHTPDPSEAACRPQMPLVGLVGPFCVGLIRQPSGKAKWSILADLHVQRGKENVVREYPRRSAELWIADDYADMYLDPIALLGAEAPRLDMGLLYSAVSHRGGCAREVEKYSACAPSATSVFIPSANAGGDQKRKHYSAADAASEAAIDTPTTPVKESDTMTPEDVQQIVGAIEQLDWVQWVKSQMSANVPPEVNPEVAPPASPMADVPLGPPDAAVPPPPTVDVPPPAAPPAPVPSTPPPAAEPDADDREKMAMRYSKASAELAELRGKVANLEAQLDAERIRNGQEVEKRINRERYSALQDCRRTREFELDEEFEQIKYGKASDDQFAAHIDRINKNYREIPIDTTLPTPGLPAPRPERERYSKEAIDRATEVCKRKSAAGEAYDYKAELEAAAKELG